MKTDYITSEGIVNSLSKYNIYIYGTGVDAEDLFRKISDKVNIIGFVDSYRWGHSFHGFEVLSKEELFRRIDKNSVVLIASYRYGIEIKAEIINDVIVSGENCFIWDDAFMFHRNSTVDRFIDFNNRIWGKYKRENRKNKILILYENYHNAMPMIYSYFANRLAEKHDAEIWAIPRRGVSSNNISPVIKSIYESINVTGFVDGMLDDDIMKETDRIVAKIWDRIDSWKDWDEINIYGIRIGTAIVRYMNRFCLPGLEPHCDSNKSILKETVGVFVYWYHFLRNNSVKAILLKDGVTWEAIISDIGNSLQIPTYALQGDGYFRRTEFRFLITPFFSYYGKFWDELSTYEKQYGIEWAEDRINKRLEGITSEIPHMEGKSIFSINDKGQARILKDTDRPKILILPHVFGEESFQCGEHLFDNNYISWLCHVGELSEELTDYEWYLKKHPNSEYRDEIIINKLLKKYERIHLIPINSSPWKLKREGLSAVLTVYGTAALDYSLIGIPAITAGANPFSCFNFCINPQNKSEYDRVIRRIESIEKGTRFDEIYKYYAINFLYYDWEKNFFSKEFFDNLNIVYEREKLPVYLREQGTWKYDEYMKEWTKEKHSNLYSKLDDMIESMDNWRADCFYKKNVMVD